MDSDDPVVNELRLLREQQWTMHRAVVARLDGLTERADQTNARLDQTVARLDQTVARLDETNARLDETNARIDQTNANLESLASYTVSGFEQVVRKQNTLQSAFERFVELTLEERRTLRPEIEEIKARLSVLERKVH